jgi:hypothetical protein
MSRPNLAWPTSLRLVAAVDLGDFAFADSDVLLILSFWLWPEQCGQQKTHSRFQPWVLVKIVSISTRANGLAYYEDYYRYYLSDISAHFELKIGNPLAKGQVLIKTNKPQVHHSGLVVLKLVQTAGSAGVVGRYASIFSMR